ncbi:polysaccharide export outer membrane protein [Variovorax boronicumulans]|uniref:polysaccharide biosynthesis/export family protein n=1 Tax=Variovorax boronicumulans TaxID=436515 RepID=UPI003392AC65
MNRSTNALISWPKAPSRLFVCLVLIVLATLLASCSRTPTLLDTRVQSLVSAQDAAPADAASYTFAAGDEFDLRVPDAPQFDQTARVRPDGQVSLPLVGTVRFQGRTVEDVQNELRSRMDSVAGNKLQREYLLHPNDEIDIKFPFAQQLNETVRIRPDGKIQLQMVGSVQAEGLSPEALKRELGTRYRRWLRKSDVAVIVRSFNSQSVRTASGFGRAGLRGLEPVLVARGFQAPQIFVGGEVAKPGMLPFRRGLSLVQALVESGGHLPSGDPAALVILRRSSNNTVEVVQAGFDADRLRSPDRDILLRPYDIVVLPKSGAATLADNLNKYVFNLVPFLRNSSVGATYNIRGYQQ